MNCWHRTGKALARGVVAAPAALLPEDPDRLIVSDGLAQWDIKAVIPDDTGSIAMVFYDPQEQEARYSDWPLLPWGTDVPPEACAVRCAEGADRGVTDSAVSSAERIVSTGSIYPLSTAQS